MIENIIYASRHDNAPHRRIGSHAGVVSLWTLSGFALAACGGGGGSSSSGSTASLAVRVLQSTGFVADSDGLVNYQVPSSANRAATIPTDNMLLIIGGTGTSRDGENDGILGSSSDYTRTGDCPDGGSTCTFTVTELTITLRSGAPTNIADLRPTHVAMINLESTMMQVSDTGTGMGTFNVRIDFTDTNTNGAVSYYMVDADGSADSITQQTITVLASTHEMNPISSPFYDFRAGISNENQVLFNLILGQQEAIVYDVEYVNTSGTTITQGTRNTAIGVKYEVNDPNDATPFVFIRWLEGSLGRGGQEVKGWTLDTDFDSTGPADQFTPMQAGNYYAEFLVVDSSDSTPEAGYDPSALVNLVDVGGEFFGTSTITIGEDQLGLTVEIA